MCGQIATSTQGVWDVQAQLRGGVDEYCGFTLQPLSASIPVPASADHDGRLSSLLSSSLAAFRGMMEDDATLVSGIHEALAETDAHAARGLGLA